MTVLGIETMVTEAGIVITGIVDGKIVFGPIVITVMLGGI